MRYSLLILLAFVCNMNLLQAQEASDVFIPKKDVMVVPPPTDEAMEEVVATTEVNSDVPTKEKKKRKKKSKKKSKKPIPQLTFDIVNSGNAKRVADMKRDSIDYYRHNAAGETALTLAILNQDIHMVEALAKKAVINRKNEAGETPLTLAIKNGNLDIIKLVAKRAKAALKNDAGEAPLFLALGLGDLYLLEDLIQGGANVNRKSNGITPLARAVETNKPRTVAFLIDHKAVVNKPNDDGETPLYIATQNGYDLVAGILISKSEDPTGDANWKTKIGTPLLHVAAEFGNPEIIRLLINHGADMETLDFMENTALSVASVKGISPNIQALVQENANINHQNLQGDTPLMLASTNYKDAAVTYLLENGADATIRNYMGYAAADFYSTNVYDGLFAQKGVKQQQSKHTPSKAEKTATKEVSKENH